MSKLMNVFGSWKQMNDLPPGTADKAEKLFRRINSVFAEDTKEQIS